MGESIQNGNGSYSPRRKKWRETHQSPIPVPIADPWERLRRVRATSVAAGRNRGRLPGVVYKSVSIWLIIRPPMMVIPSGRRNSDRSRSPGPMASRPAARPWWSSGSDASAACRLRGWNRRSSCLRCVRRPEAKSIIMMAFFLTMPISRISPMIAITVRSVCVTVRASRPPTPADGIVDKIVMGWMKLSYRMPSTR